MKKSLRNNEGVNYWESLADTMIGLLFMTLLIMVLLILYIIKIPDEEAVDEEGNITVAYDENGEEEDGEDSGALNERPDTGEYDAGSDYEYGYDDEGDGAAFGEEDGHHYDDPDPGAGNGEGTDRSSVLIQLIDEETGETVKKAGVSFELYNHNGTLQVLSVYYPNKVDYSSFETDADGTFYLPERIPLRETYTLHELSTVGGYDLAENTSFQVDRSYDWSEPYVVSVYVSPSKNKIAVTLKDSSNNASITGASFDVVAENDISIEGGTIKYKQGDIVDTIVLDENGKGESSELYLGQYLLRQNEIPQYYGRIIGDTAVDLSGKRDSAVSASLTETKTSITVSLVDALYDSTLIEGAEFKFTDSNGKVIETCTTDSEGRFTVTDLKKNTTYHLIQKETVGAYQPDTADHAITISADGLIDGDVNKAMTVRNRIIRTAIGVQDKLFHNQVSNISMLLLDADGNTVKKWSSSGMEQSIEGLEPGTYQVVIEGDNENIHYITIENKTDIQTYEFERWTLTDIVSIACGSVTGVVILFLLIFFIRRFRNKRHSKRRNKQKLLNNKEQENKNNQ